MWKLILLNAQIADGDPVGRMVEDFHQHDRWNALLPCVVSEGFTQGVTAYMLLKPCILGSFACDTECLEAAERLSFDLFALKQIVCLPCTCILRPKLQQLVPDHSVDCHNVKLSCLLFIDAYMMPYFFLVKIDILVWIEVM